jgi:hypothetical protein
VRDLGLRDVSELESVGAAEVGDLESAHSAAS